MDVWVSILVAITSNAIALAVLGFLAKSLIGGWLNKDLERHRNQLQRETETALTTHRSLFHLRWSWRSGAWSRGASSVICEHIP